MDNSKIRKKTSLSENVNFGLLFCENGLFWCSLSEKYGLFLVFLKDLFEKKTSPATLLNSHCPYSLFVIVIFYILLVIPSVNYQKSAQYFNLRVNYELCSQFCKNHIATFSEFMALKQILLLLAIY